MTQECAGINLQDKRISKSHNFSKKKKWLKKHRSEFKKEVPIFLNGTTKNITKLVLPI